MTAKILKNFYKTGSDSEDDEDNSKLDVEKLLTALDNENNSSIGDLTTAKIKTYKNNALQKLQLPRDELKKLHKKLENYRLIEEMEDLQYGHHIRWIRLTTPEKIFLTNGGIVCDIQVINEEAHVRCFNRYKKLMQIKLDECYIFQKLSDQEQVILNVLDYLAK